MGKISSYGTASAPSLGDKLIGTSVGGSPVNGTYNFTIQQLADLISGQITLQEVLTAGNTATQSINLTGVIAATSLIVGNITSSGTITSNGITLAGNLSASGFSYIYSTQTLNITNSTITGTFKDRTGSAGALGQVLSSSVTGTQWITPVIPTLQQVLDAGNNAIKNVFIQGTISVIGGVAANGFSLTNDDYFYVGEAGAVIGYSNDDEKLTIKNIVSNGIVLINNGSSLELLDNDISFNANGVFYFNVLGSQKMIIDNYGNIGLGISVVEDANPNRKIIQINATVASATVNLSVANVIYGTCTASNTDYAILSRNNANLEIGTASGGAVKFVTQDNQKMTLDSNGSLLINRSTSLASYYKLQVEGSVYVAGDITANLVGALSFQVYDTLFVDSGIGTGIGIVGQYGNAIIATWDYDDSGDYIYGNRALVVNSLGGVKMNSLPTASTGQSGDLYIDGGFIKIVV